MRPVRLLLALAWLLGPGAALAAPTIWVTEATRKLRPTSTPLSTATSTHLFAARNEFEAFQLVVQGPADGVRVLAPDLAGPGGGAVAAKLFREGLINLQNKSSTDGWTGPTPDPMLPDKDDVVGETRNAFPFNVPAGESRVVWVEYRVPDNAVAGDYAGTVTVQSTQGNATAQVTLTVWPFKLPSTSSLRSHFGVSYGGLPAGHGVSGAEFSRLRARYSQLGLDHRISMGYFDDGVDTTGNFETFYAALVSGTAPTQLPGARLTTVQYVTGGYQTWVDFFTNKGWPAILFQYTCDEPPMTCQWSDIPGRAAQARAAGIPTLVTTSVQEADAHGVTSAIDIMVPVINFMDDRSGTYAGDQSSKYAAYTASGDLKELWTYQSCMSHGCGGDDDGWASYMIDAAAIRARAQEWLSFVWGATGELYWDTTFAYTHDAWTNQWDFTGNGDGTLLYPGTPAKIGGATHIPVASLRLKMIREGYEDFEYLKMVSDLGDPSFARQTAKALFPHPYAVEPSVSELMAARAALAQRILELLGLANQSCSDGTAANQCSAAKPRQCKSGALIDACAACGCPADQSCQPDGTCKAALVHYAAALPAPATVDGKLPEYETLPAITLSGKSATGSAQVRAGWTSEALYLAFEVTDDALRASAAGEENVWDGDGVELMLDTKLDRSASADTNDFHVVVGVSGQVSDARAWTDYAFSAGATAVVDLEGATLPGPSVGPGYRVELKVPWAALGVTPSDGLRLGFDVALNDKDSTASPVSQDFAGLQSFNDPQAWGVLELEPRTAADGGTAGADDAAGLGDSGAQADASTSPKPDGGTIPAGDTGSPPDGAARLDAGLPPIEEPFGSCGCSGAAGEASLALFALLGLLRRRGVIR